MAILGTDNIWDLEIAYSRRKECFFFDEIIKQPIA
jgi:hypothetical protein